MTPETARAGQAATVEAVAEAVQDGDDRSVRRLAARFAEPAAVADLDTLRDALDAARPSGNREGNPPRRPGS